MQQLAAALYARATQEADSGEAKRDRSLISFWSLAKNSAENSGFLLGLCVPISVFLSSAAERTCRASGYGLPKDTLGQVAFVYKHLKTQIAAWPYLRMANLILRPLMATL